MNPLANQDNMTKREPLVSSQGQVPYAEGEDMEGGRIGVGSHVLLAGEHVVAELNQPDLCCLCVPVGAHIVTLTNKRLLAEKKNFFSPGGVLATAPLKHVVAAELTKGSPSKWWRPFSVLALWGFVDIVTGDNGGWGLFIPFLLLALFFYYLRPRAVTFKVGGYSESDNLFESSGHITKACEKDRKLMMLQKYAQVKDMV